MTETLKASDYAKQMKALIDTPEKWTTGSYARDCDGLVVALDSKSAVCYCSLGAIGAIDSPIEIRDSIYGAVEQGFKHKGKYTVVAMNNDSSTHEEVMEAWDRAIAILEDHEKENKNEQ